MRWYRRSTTELHCGWLPTALGIEPKTFGALLEVAVSTLGETTRDGVCVRRKEEKAGLKHCAWLAVGGGTVHSG